MKLVSHKEKNIKIDWRKEGRGRSSYEKKKPTKEPHRVPINQDLEQWLGDLQ